MQPATPIPFIGREAVLARLLDAVAAPGVVLVHGPAGVGKTRLAHAVAEHVAPSAFVDLTQATSLDAILSAVSDVLHTPAPRSDPAGSVDAVRRALVARRALLILDNAEQVADALATVLPAWSAASPVLVTSQVQLPARAEVHLEPLASDAARSLFRAVSHQAWPPSQETAVGALVDRVGGLPLAVVLAAARCRVLAPSQLLARLDEPLRWLRTDAPGRHGTLARALGHAWELLDPDQRHALAQASVFRGAFTVELAEQVLRVPGEVPDVLATLADRSLLERSATPTGEPLYALLPAIRAFAAAHLVDDGVGLRHAEAFLREPLPPITFGSVSFATRTVLARERHDLLAIVDRFGNERPDLAGRAVLRLGPWLLEHDSLQRHDDLLTAALSPEPSELDGKLLLARARVRKAQARIPEALADVDGALALAEALDLVPLQVVAHATRGAMSYDRRDADEARAAYLRAGALARDAGVHEVDGMILHGLAIHAIDHGSHAEAESLFARCLRAHRRLTDRVGEAATLLKRARLRRRQNRLEDALDDVAAAVALCRVEGRILPTALTHLAILEGRLGRFEDARRSVAEALELARRTGHVNDEAYATSLAAFTEQAAGELVAARSLNYDVLALAEEQGLERVAIQAHSDLVSTLFELGDLDGAAFHLGPSLAGWDHPAPRAVMLAWEAVLAWTRDQRDEGDRSIAEARALADQDTVGVEAVALLRSLEGFRHAMLARVALAAEDLPQAAAHRADAEAAVVLGRSGHDVGGIPGPDALIAARCLERQVAGLIPALEVDLEGAWFRVPGVGRQDLATRASARRVLVALVERRVASPGEALTQAELLAAGWPDERVTIATAGPRVHVTLSTLRKLGLREWILTTADGWLLDPRRPVLTPLARPSRAPSGRP